MFIYTNKSVDFSSNNLSYLIEKQCPYFEKHTKASCHSNENRKRLTVFFIQKGWY